MSEAEETCALRKELRGHESELWKRLAVSRQAMRQLQREMLDVKHEIGQVRFALRLLPREGQDE